MSGRSSDEPSGPAFPEALRRRLRQGSTPRHPSREGDREAAVLIPLFHDPTAGPSLLGIIRAEGGHHGGQFAFPGGRVEDDDDGPWDAALREAGEEIGLEAPLERLGVLGQFNTVVSSFRVIATVAWLERRPERFVLQESEVAAVLSVPIARLLRQARTFPPVRTSWELPIGAGFEFDPEGDLLEGIVPPRGRGHRIGRGEEARTMPFIWGLSARMIWELLRLVPED